MALSYSLQNGNGSTVSFVVPFQYIDKSHVHVYVNDAETLSFTWTNSVHIQFTSAPSLGTGNVKLVRVTPRDRPLIDFSNGSVLFDSDLDVATLQSLFIAQEYFEQAVVGVVISDHATVSHTDVAAGTITAKGSVPVYNDGAKYTTVTPPNTGEIFIGDSIDPKGVRWLTGGSTGNVLEYDTSVSPKLKWGQGLRNFLTTAGDFIVATVSGVAARFAGPISDNLVLVSDLAQAQRMKWSSVLAGLTLTSPVINTAVINSPTITAPVLSGTATGTYTLGGTPTITGATLSTPTLSSPTITGNTVGINALKTATGATVSTLFDAQHVDLLLNDYAFSPSVSSTSLGIDNAQIILTPRMGGDPGTYAGRFGISNPHNTTNSLTVTYSVRWRYITASDNPVIWIARNAVGQIMSVWASDDPTPGDLPGIEMKGAIVTRHTSMDLERLVALSAKADEAADYIQSNKLRMEHQAYRALQLLTGDPAPASWLHTHVSLDETGKLVEVRA